MFIKIWLVGPVPWVRCFVNLLSFVLREEFRNGGNTMEMIIVKKKVPVKKEAVVAAKIANKKDFEVTMAAVRQQLFMSRYEFLAALTGYIHDEARRDGVPDNPAC